MKTQPTLLIIDDEPDNFDVIEALLDDEGYELSYVSGGYPAIELLATFQPDVILLDVMMPQMSGIEFCQQFKANPQWQHIPVIIITALTAKEDLSRCLSAGADDFISKPLNGLELRSRIRSMLRIKQQYDALQATLNLREDLSRMIVHDLRNPLSAILVFAEILQSTGYSPERQQEKTTQIITAAQQLRSMIDSLLMMAKLESGKLILQRTEVDFSELCTAAISDIEPIAAQKNLQIVSHLPAPGRPVNVDVIIFRRVLDNLLSNAIKFSPSNSTITLKAEYLEQHRARVQIADKGPGISQETRHSIFEKYEVGTLMENASQIGLGLAFCKMAIEAHGGQITVEDNQPKGAIFTIEF